jgi:hypothetical protein
VAEPVRIVQEHVGEQLPNGQQFHHRARNEAEIVEPGAEPVANAEEVKHKQGGVADQQPLNTRGHHGRPVTIVNRKSGAVRHEPA